MIEIASGFPERIFAISGEGKVTAEDYRDVLIPEAAQRIKKFGSIRMLCHLGPGFEGLTPGAAWSDLKFGLSRWNEIERFAVVTDVTWITDALILFAPFFPHPIRVFAEIDLEEAKRWIMEDMPASGS